MRWITFFIFLYLMTVLQMGALGGFPHGQDVWPRIEYLPILAIFYALYAAEPAAPLCGLICGMSYDIGNASLIGTQAVPLALVAYVVVRVRLSIFREHFLSQLLITLLALLGFDVLETIMRVIVGAKLDSDSVWTHFGHMTANAAYSCVVAPIIYWLFFRVQPVLGFNAHGPRTRMHDGRR